MTKERIAELRTSVVDANRAFRRNEFYFADVPTILNHVLECLDEIERLQKNEAYLKDAEQQAGNLLAVIHHDGGHYIQYHGWKKASEDAIADVLRLRKIVDAAKDFSDTLQSVVSHPAYKAVWEHFHNSGHIYRGPFYDHKLQELIDTLAAAQTPKEK